MIEFKNVYIETRHPILTDECYSFKEGMIYGIVGINGSGKTTTFRTMMDLLKPKSGQILFDGEPVTKKRDIVFYYETVEWLDLNLSGKDYLNFVQKIWKSQIPIDSILQEWGMEDYINIPIKKYSLGMKQKLVACMYIISDAKYLIMDELTSALDENNRQYFFNQIQNLKKQGKTIILSSHYKEEIYDYCDKVISFRDHKLCEDKT